MNTQASIFEQLFNISIQDPSCIEVLQKEVTRHPYFTPAQFFLLQQMDKNDSSYQKQAALTALLFNNHYWLQYQLQQKNADSDNIQSIVTETTISDNTNDINTNTTQSSVENNTTASTLPITLQTPQEEKLIFEPLFVTDYFASQGIKISEEAQPTDKLGKQLKSFTDWLKTMKKIHTDKQPPAGEVNDLAIQQLAEKSNTDEEILTESMAEVFAKQNKISKAIEVYEKLSLLNPSKSAYFAAKIQQLKGI